ncbi:MAG: septum formation initiator family protein [Clostridia bacterium]|nr:septum formation initiator family protein [Clostridia bacterium]
MVLLIVCVKLNMVINDSKDQIVKMQLEIEKRQLENERIENEVKTFELNEETIKKIAREKLGLRDNDTIIFENSQPN